MRLDREFQDRVFPWLIAVAIIWMVYSFLLEPLTRGLSWRNQEKENPAVTTSAERPVPLPLRVEEYWWRITPSLDNLSLSEAEKIATVEHLRVEVVEIPGEPIGQVVARQFPEAGDGVYRGTTIKVVLGPPPMALAGGGS